MFFPAGSAEPRLVVSQVCVGMRGPAPTPRPSPFRLALERALGLATWEGAGPCFLWGDLGFWALTPGREADVCRGQGRSGVGHW